MSQVCSVSTCVCVCKQDTAAVCVCVLYEVPASPQINTCAPVLYKSGQSDPTVTFIRVIIELLLCPFAQTPREQPYSVLNKLP